MTSAVSMKERCKHKIWHRFVQVNCKRNPAKDGYCTQHHPDTIKARREASQAAWEAKWAAKESAYEAAEAKQSALERDAARYRWIELNGLEALGRVLGNRPNGTIGDAIDPCLQADKGAR